MASGMLGALHETLRTVPRRVAGRLVAVLAVACCLPACRTTQRDARESTVPSNASIERVLFAMGTDLRIQVSAADRATALAASELAVRAIEDTEARLSTWRADSELSQLNRTPIGQPFELSPTTANELGRALELARITDGAFDPTVGALVEAWDLRGEGRIPGDQDLAAAMARTGFEHLELNGLMATRHADVQLDAGAFGKGAGLDAAIVALRRTEATSAMVDLGGQLAYLGSAPRATPIANPRDRAKPAVLIHQVRGSIATTSNSERSIAVGVVRVGHILDPRRGQPAPNFGSATVVADRALDADALATAAFVLGPTCALFEQRHDTVVWLLANRNDPPVVHHTSSLIGRVETLPLLPDSALPDGEEAPGTPPSTN
jgi:FAD:protein FMN transferase